MVSAIMLEPLSKLEYLGSMLIDDPIRASAIPSLLHLMQFTRGRCFSACHGDNRR